MKNDSMIAISLAFAPTASEQLYMEMEVKEGTQLLQALVLVGWLNIYPDLQVWCQSHQFDSQIDKKFWRVGVFSDKKLLSYQLKANDRVEVYRPLSIDPMHKRKNRAIQQ